MMPRGGYRYLIAPLLHPMRVMARIVADLPAPASAEIDNWTRIIVVTILLLFLRGSSATLLIRIRRPFFFLLLRPHETTVGPVVIVVAPAAGPWR